MPISCAFVGTTSGGATGSSHFETGSQNGGNWMKPAIVASTASTPTVQRIEIGPSPWSVCRCSRTNALGSPRKTRKMRRKV